MDLPVVELRRYTLVPGRRDEMIEIFEQELMEPQQAAGMTLLGTFRDLDEPDHFVWLRGFPDLGSRLRSLTEFYAGPVWKRHGPRIRPTMVDTDDVYLLRPAGPGTGLAPAPLPPRDAPAEPDGLVLVTVRPPAPPGPDGFAAFVTEPAENTYPGLPVRTGETVTVTLRHPDAEVRPAPGVARLLPTARSPLRARPRS